MSLPHAAEPAPHVVVREAQAQEYALVGQLTAAAYVDDGYAGDEYARVLADAAVRAAGALLLVATLQESVVATVTLALPGARYRDVARQDEAEVRMLAVAPAARRRGVARRLVHECVERARAAGCRAVVLSSQTAMRPAHRLYEQLGFRRVPQRDWSPRPGVDLLFYELEL